MKMRVDVKLPRYGTSMEEGTVARWLKAPGDLIEKGEPLCEIETEKVTADFECPLGGTLSEIKVAGGDIAAVGDVICTLEVEVP